MLNLSKPLWMNKTLSLLLCMVILVSCFALTACGSGKGQSGSTDLSGSKYLGTWKTSALSLLDTSESVDESDDLGKVTITLLEDGTGHMDSPEEVSNFTWEEIDGGFKTSGDVKATFKDDGDGIKAKIIGVELHFEKQ